MNGNKECISQKKGILEKTTTNKAESLRRTSFISYFIQRSQESIPLGDHVITKCFVDVYITEEPSDHR